MSATNTALCECGCGEPAPIAKFTKAAYGHVKGWPVRFIAGHNMYREPPSAANVLARATACDLGHDTPCLLWPTSLVGKRGYGFFTLNGRRSYAHRYIFERVNGPIPEGLQLDHLCRVRACVNPDHLEPVEQKINIRRGSLTKLTQDDVDAIRASNGSCRELSERYGVHSSQISRIRTRRAWR